MTEPTDTNQASEDDLYNKLLNLRLTVWKQTNLNGQASLDHDSVEEVLALITTQKQELLSEIEKELPELALITNDDGGIDLARKSAANNVLDQVKSIITTKREGL